MHWEGYFCQNILMTTEDLTHSPWLVDFHAEVSFLFPSFSDNVSFLSLIMLHKAAPDILYRLKSSPWGIIALLVSFSSESLYESYTKECTIPVTALIVLTG